MSDRIPRPVLKKISHTTTPTTSDSTIMDDTVMTMDGAGLMGGPTTAIPATRQTVVTTVPKVHIRRRR